MEADRLHEAAAVLHEGHEKYPCDAEICLHLGWVSHRMHDENALHFARRVVELEPDDAWVTLGVGWLLFYLEAYGLAALELKLTRRNASERDVHLVTKIGILTGKLASMQGRADVAEEVFRDMDAYDPNDLEAGLELFALLHNQGRHADARSHLEAMLRRAPHDEHLLQLERETRSEPSH
jgi:tetratricopeptide (TPR) repeat protein